MVAPLAPHQSLPTSRLRRPLAAAQKATGPALQADHLHFAQHEVMPCELSILLPSIVRPSVSTGCSPCSTASRALRAIRPIISSAPARTPTAFPLRWRA